MSDRDQMRIIADRLGEIATNVSGEASGLTHQIRAVGAHARDIATLARELDDAAQRIETSVQAQLRLLARARGDVHTNEPVMAALAGSAATIAEMSVLVGEIAGRSRLLSLNARIEAARAGETGGGFASVAAAMTDLSAQTHQATTGIQARAAAIGDNVEAAQGVIAAGACLLEVEERMIAAIADTAERQRSTAGHVAALTAESVSQIDDAAAGIGRVASAATVVGVLARQLTRVAADTKAAA